MRILVIGGTRFIGPYVIRRLHALGHSLLLYHRRPASVELPPDIPHLYDEQQTLTDRSGLASFAAEFRRFAPDVALDTIAMTEPVAQTTVAALRGIAGRLVVLSSADVYRAYGRVRGSEPGPPDPVPLAEDAPLRDKPYPLRGPTPAPEEHSWIDRYDKILVEQAVQSDPALPGTVLRLPAVYGPHDGQRRLWPYLKRIDDGRPAILIAEEMAEWRWTRAYVENVAEAIVLAVTDARAAGRTYNVGDPQAYAEADWIAQIAAVTGWQGAIVRAPSAQLPPSLQPGIDTAQALETDTSRIRRELGYVEPVPLDEALRRTVAWERANPPATSDPAAFDYAAEDAALAQIR